MKSNIFVAVCLFLASLFFLFLPIGSDGNSVERVKVIENNTITYVEIPKSKNVFKEGDTIWVDLAKHVIDDTSNTTMKAIILPTNNK